MISFDIWMENGTQLDLNKCKRLARNSLLAKEGEIASGEMIEIAEVIVPKMAEELEALRDMEDDAIVNDRVLDEMGSRTGSVNKAVNAVKIDVSNQHVKFIMDMGKGKDPLVVSAKVDPSEWERVPELSDRISRMYAAIDKL